MNIQYRGELLLKQKDGTEYWRPTGAVCFTQEAAFEEVYKAIEVNDILKYWDIRKVRVISRTISDWETVAEGTIMEVKENG